MSRELPQQLKRKLLIRVSGLCDDVNRNFKNTVLALGGEWVFFTGELGPVNLFDHPTCIRAMRP